MEKPTSKRKEREKEARRQAILDAAGRVFSRKGFYEATLDEIAAEAELAKGTLYNYYKDKQDIFVSLFARGYDQYLRRLSESVRTDGSLHEFIRHVFDISLRSMQDHGYMIRAMLTGGMQSPDGSRSPLMEHWLNHVKVICENLAAALNSHPEAQSLSEEERLTAAKLILGSVRFLFITHMMEAKPDISDNEIENFTRLICRALKSEKTE
jgi:AcrR family transcriptional regulator